MAKIIEKDVPNIDNKPINVKKKDIPQSTNKSLPLLYHTQLYIGKKGVGKTYKMIKILQAYEKSKIKDNSGNEYKMRIIVISPTAKSGANVVYETLQSLNDEDIHFEYSDELLLDILDDIKNKKDEYDEYLEYKRIYDKFIKIKKIERLGWEDIEILELHDFQSPKEVYGEIYPYITWILFDDLVGTGSFTKKMKSAINNLTIKHRHLQTNLIFTTQSYKQLPRIIRNNIDIYVVFKTGSELELNGIYEDVSGYIKYEEFVKLYDYATEERNDALIIINNSMDKRGTLYYKNWDKELVFSNLEND